MEMFF